MLGRLWCALQPVLFLPVRGGQRPAVSACQLGRARRRAYSHSRPSHLRWIQSAVVSNRGYPSSVRGIAMNTLTTPPLSTLLSQLFADADATSAKLEQARGFVPAQQRAAVMNTADYRSMYMAMKEFHLAVSPETG